MFLDNEDLKLIVQGLETLNKDIDKVLEKEWLWFTKEYDNLTSKQVDIQGLIYKINDDIYEEEADEYRVIPIMMEDKK